VFLHKVVNLNVSNVKTQLNAINGLVSRLISTMKEASTTGTHVCHIYSEMLERLWHCRNPMQESSRRLFLNTELDLDHTLHGPFVDQLSLTQPLNGSVFEDQLAGDALLNAEAGSSNIFDKSLSPFCGSVQDQMGVVQNLYKVQIGLQDRGMII